MRTKIKVLIFILIVHLDSVLYANDMLSIDNICTKPITWDSKILTVCNDINFSDRTANHAIFLKEIDDDLNVIKATKLNLKNSDVVKIIKVDNTYAYLIAETQSNCIQVSALNFTYQSVHLLFTYCDEQQLSIPLELNEPNIIRHGHNLIFPIDSEDSNVTTVKLMHIDENNNFHIKHIPEYQNYIPMYFVKFSDKDVLLMRSKVDQKKSVLLSVNVNSSGDIHYTKIYETSELIVMALANINDQMYIAGNPFTDQTIFFSLYRINSLNSVDKIVDHWPIPLRPTLIRKENDTLKVYGVLVDEDLQAIATGNFKVNPDSNPPIKVDKWKKLTTKTYPLPIADNQSVSYLIPGNQTYLLSKGKNYMLNSTNLTAFIYPNIVHLKEYEYFFCVHKEKGQVKSTIEMLK